MTACAAAGASFLLAVLWFDLMFDVQVRKHSDDVLPAAVLGSISAYYRRVTTEANPMGRLVAVVMLLTLAALISELPRGSAPRWIAGASLAFAAAAVGLALARTVRNAVRLGGAQDPPQVQSGLARSIWRDHLFCFAAMAAVVCLQLAAAL